MRYLTAVLRPVERIHPSIPPLIDLPEVTPIAIQQTRLLDDGTEMTLMEVRGDLDRLRTVYAGRQSVLEFDIAGDREGIVYCHSEPHDRARRLLQWLDEHELVVQPPFQFTGDGGLRVTFLGDDETFQRAMDALPDDIEDDVRIEIEAIGDYHPEMDDVFASLTDRQREVLETAIREGYYEQPRRVSQRDVADRLGIAPSTVSQTLQRIEANVFSAYLLDEADTDDG